MSETLTSASLARITSEEITSQPECWPRAHAQAINPPARLPATGERAPVRRCGTSYYVAAAYAWLRDQGGRGTWGKARA
jgi:hypothetical protein